MCNTDNSLSNCFDQYKRSKGSSAAAMVASTASVVSSSQNFQVIPLNFNGLTCPFCRGDVTGFIVVDNVRAYFDMKKRCCQEKHCEYVGNYVELQQHARQEHPNSRPSEVDPEREREWESFQQSSRDEASFLPLGPFNKFDRANTKALWTKDKNTSKPCCSAT
ncbi:hypothetical protein ZIOFF_070698 [Zingiber officinale]|uniref:Uncharacterized protein n=1 Tax=Zingiber officinale TaxID=94328 RepID=A0A8J5C8P1_ZINOF|nr:hypothetical protein ZIOFF_070698 [Zingiber officinale]